MTHENLSIERESDLGVLSELPGDLMMWVLILSELLLFPMILVAD